MPWAGVAALDEDWLVYVGPIAATAQHAHHATQIIVSTDGPELRLRVADRVVRAPTIVVGPNVAHAIESDATCSIIVFTRPESHLSDALRERVLDPAPFAARSFRAASTIEIPTRESAVALVDRITSQLVGPHPFVRRDRPDVVTRALAILPDALIHGSVALDAIARECGVSASRFRHLFMASTGSSWRAFVRWERLVRATASASTGASLTAAAHDAGFADAAHFTRTFRAMFGLTPSEVLFSLRWIAK